MTDHPSREHADELNRFWNAAATGDAPGDEFALELEEMQLIRSLQRAGAAATPASTPELAWHGVRARIAADSPPLPAFHALTISASAVAANGHAGPVRPRPVTPPPRPRSRWLLNSLATAALVILTVVGTLVAVGLRPLRPESAHIAPVDIASAPFAAVQTETLVDASVKALPNGHATVQVGLHVLQPEVSGYWPVVGTRVFAIDRGTVEIVGSDAAHALHAGDQLTLETPEGFTMRNVGDVEARVMEVAVLDGTAVTSPSNATHSYSDPTGGRVDWVIVAAATLPEDADYAKVERITVLPNAALEPFAATGMEWIGIAQGRLGVTLEGERLPFRWDSGEERTYGVFRQLPPIHAGTAVTLRNAGPDPLVLYRLAIAPMPAAGPESAAPAITTETLLDAPVTSLPAGHASVWVTFHRLQPGVSGTWPGMVGASFLEVAQGTVEIRAADAVQMLHAGDQLPLAIAEGFTLRNVGTEEARVMEVDLLDAVATSAGPGSHFFYSDPLGGHGDFVIQIATTLPGGKGQLKLERLTLPAGAALPTYAATGLDWLGIEQGRVGVTLEGDDLPFRWDSGEERTYGARQQIPLLPIGAQITLRNAADTPLLLYRLTLVT